MLMLDRYLVGGGRALDLATGAAIRWHARPLAARLPPLFAVRGKSWLIDFDRRGQSRIEIWEQPVGAKHDAVNEAVASCRACLADARDGRPRTLDLSAATMEQWLFTQRVLARE